MEAQVQIWITDRPLKETAWLEAGFNSLKDYVLKLSKEGDANIIRKHQNLPLASFGFFNTKTGQKNIQLVCNTVDDLPTQSIDGLLEFNDSNDRGPDKEGSNK